MRGLAGDTDNSQQSAALTDHINFAPGWRRIGGCPEFGA